MKTATRLILRDMLPMAFASEPERHSSSDIWPRPGMEFIPGERYLVRSESGGGKSSMCSYLHGNRDDYSGTLIIGDRNARHLSVRDWTTLRRETLAYLPQDMGLFPTLTAIENVRLKNRLTNHKTEEEIMEMLDTVGIGQPGNFPSVNNSAWRWSGHCASHSPSCCSTNLSAISTARPISPSHRLSTGKPPRKTPQ